MISILPPLLDFCQLAIEMRERGLQRRAAAFVGALHLVKDATSRELQPFAFLPCLDLVDIRTALAARGALILGILPIRLNRLAFESSCHGKNRVHAARPPANASSFDAANECDVSFRAHGESASKPFHDFWRYCVCRGTRLRGLPVLRPGCGLLDASLKFLALDRGSLGWCSRARHHPQDFQKAQTGSRESRETDGHPG